MLGYSQPLGLSQTYIDAQRIVTALDRARVDPTYFDSAAEILNSYVEPERTEVVNKAIALGADPEIIRSLLVGTEVIVIEEAGPVIAGRKIPWWQIGAGTLALVGGFLAYRKYAALR